MKPSERISKSRNSPAPSAAPAPMVAATARPPRRASGAAGMSIWLGLVGAGVLFVVVTVVAFVLVLLHSRQQAARERAEIENGRAESRREVETHERQLAEAEARLEQTRATVVNLRKRAAAASADGAAARQELQTLEDAGRRYRGPLEDELKKAQETAKRIDGAALRDAAQLQTKLREAKSQEEALQSLVKDARAKAKPAAERVKATAGGGTVGDDPGDLSDYAQQIGKTFLFRVTGDVSGSVYGSGPYTTDSPLATAAVHAGVLRKGQTGVVRVVILAGQKSYRATTRNGVATSDWLEYHASYRVYPKE